MYVKSTYSGMNGVDDADNALSVLPRTTFNVRMGAVVCHTTILDFTLHTGQRSRPLAVAGIGLLRMQTAATVMLPLPLRPAPWRTQVLGRFSSATRNAHSYFIRPRLPCLRNSDYVR